MKRLAYILPICALAFSCQREMPMEESRVGNSELNAEFTRAGGWGYIGDIAYDPVADTLYMVADMGDGNRDTSIYTLRSKGADTIYASDAPFYYEDVKNATFEIFGYGNVGMETASKITVYPEMDQHDQKVFERNNYVRTENIHLSKVDENLPMSASNHVLSATLEPQFTMLRVLFSLSSSDGILDSLIFLSDKGDIYPIEFKGTYRAIISPENMRSPLKQGEVPTKNNSIVKIIIRREITNERICLYAGYTLSTPITNFKGIKLNISLGVVNGKLSTHAQIEPWRIEKCIGTATYKR